MTDSGLRRATAAAWRYLVDWQSAGPPTLVSQAASRRNASVVGAHTAEEIICVVCVAAPDRPAAIAVALAVVADALKAESPVPSPSR